MSLWTAIIEIKADFSFVFCSLIRTFGEGTPARKRKEKRAFLLCFARLFVPLPIDMTFEVKDAVLGKGAERCVQGLSFIVKERQMVAVDVPFGMGTAFVHALLGLCPLDEGVVSIDGEPLTELSASPLRHDLMGYVPRHITMPDGEEKRFRKGELRRMLMEEVATARKAIVLVDGLNGDDEREACEQMAYEGAAVVVVNEVD